MVHKTERLFSSIAPDHTHEQLNSEVKEEGEQLGLQRTLQHSEGGRNSQRGMHPFL